MPDERATLLLAALMMEALVGYPSRLHVRVPHPVVWAGAAIGWLEARWNRGSEPLRRVMGVAALLALSGVAVAAGLALARLLSGWPLSVGLAAVATLGLAQRSLHDHVTAAARPLARGDLAAARTAAAMIVGCDASALDAGGVAAAATESLAESFCDGIVAPAFWFLVAGLPGMFLYKLVNTADSMVGHRDARHAAYPGPAALAHGLRLYRRACLLLCLLVGALAWAG
ncbi:CobD/CbiB family cobalamin biosynthesis protein [Thermaurantiacus sp.]